LHVSHGAKPQLPTELLVWTGRGWQRQGFGPGKGFMISCIALHNHHIVSFKIFPTTRVYRFKASTSYPLLSRMTSARGLRAAWARLMVVANSSATPTTCPPLSESPSTSARFHPPAGTKHGRLIISSVSSYATTYFDLLLLLFAALRQQIKAQATNRRRRSAS
jgi:hypothetical protein